MRKKTLFETAEIMGYSPRTIDRINRKVKKKIVKVGRVKKRKFFMRPFSYKYNSSYISQKSV